MRVFRSLAELPAAAFTGGSAVAIGKFDGVHLGHRALLDSITAAARSDALESVVFTFEQNPLSLLSPARCPEPIMSPEQRLEALAEASVGTCVMVPFDRFLAEMPAAEFVAEVLVKRLRARHVALGRDFRFGHQGAGDAGLLTELGLRYGFTVEVIDQIEDRELGRISSSRIRDAILRGEVSDAARMLGRSPAVRGEVVRGDARGRELGFPTANLGSGQSGPLEGLRPAEGVYAGWAMLDGVRYAAAISVGVNLTFDAAGEPRVEAHLLDFSGEVYGKRMEIRFVERLRGMVAFPDAAALRARMLEDVRETRVRLLAAE